MRIKLMLAVLLFLMPSNLYGSKENENFKFETENMDTEQKHEDNTYGSAVKTVVRREAGELTDDYHKYPLCGDKPMFAWSTYTCYCGNRTLSAGADLSDRDYYCCVPPSVAGQDHCKYAKINEHNPRFSDVRCEKGKVSHKTEPCHQSCWNSYRQSEKLYKTATMNLPSIGPDVFRSLQ